MLKRLAKKILFPGLDVHLRSRYRYLSLEFCDGPVRTLDAGCGNGALSYAAFCKGSKVLGVSDEPDSIERARSFFCEAQSDQLKFEVMNLYDLNRVNEKYDQIICSETLEHITKDTFIIQQFYRLLNPGGVLHLCCPNSKHPEHALGRVNNPEDGGHVRDGYTLESYKLLLEPQGFLIKKSFGVGSIRLVKLDRIVRKVRSWGGEVAAIPIFLILWPFLNWVDTFDPPQPFSIYVKAIKNKV